MQLTFEQVPLDSFREAGTAPAIVIDRRRTEEWLIAGPVELDKPIQWGYVRDGTGVYIPLVPYRLPHDANLSLLDIFARGVHAGHAVKAEHAPLRLHLVTADVTEDLESEGLPGYIRFHLGIAVRIK